ncbi:MAG: hypothetical protein WBZ36_22340 [Candidatus Nitrosopolaris sp.]
MKKSILIIKMKRLKKKSNINIGLHYQTLRIHQDVPKIIQEKKIRTRKKNQ